MPVWVGQLGPQTLWGLCAELDRLWERHKGQGTDPPQTVQETSC